MLKWETIFTNLKGFATKYSCITSGAVVSSYQILLNLEKDFPEAFRGYGASFFGSFSRGVFYTTNDS